MGQYQNFNFRYFIKYWYHIDQV